MDVSVIIINYNTYDLTVQTIESLFDFTKDLAYEIILIDNNSPDGSGKRLKERFGDKIKFIQAEENLGTSKAVNRCFAVSSGKYILWLNSDVVFIENFIKKLYDFMEENPACGVCGGNLVDLDRNPVHSYKKEIITVKSIKEESSIIRTFFRKVFKKKLSLEYNYSDSALNVGYITGADMFFRRELFDLVGGIDENIFMYCEEVEFQYRVKNQAGFSIFSVPWAKLIHLEGKSFSGKNFNPVRFKMNVQGTVFYLKKHFGIKFAKKYLVVLKNKYNKFIFIYSVMLNRKKIKTYKNKKDIVKEFLNKDLDFDRSK